MFMDDFSDFPIYLSIYLPIYLSIYLYIYIYILMWPYVFHIYIYNIFKKISRITVIHIHVSVSILSFVYYIVAPFFPTKYIRLYIWLHVWIWLQVWVNARPLLFLYPILISFLGHVPFHSWLHHHFSAFFPRSITIYHCFFLIGWSTNTLGAVARSRRRTCMFRRSPFCWTPNSGSTAWKAQWT